MKHPAKSQPALMIVGGAQGETVLDNQELELYTASTVLSPGEKAKVFALLPANWGKAETGTIWETISGRKIYDTRPSAFKGRSRWFEVEARPEYGTGFYHTVTVPMSGGKYREQTLGFQHHSLDQTPEYRCLPGTGRGRTTETFQDRIRGQGRRRSPVSRHRTCGHDC